MIIGFNTQDDTYTSQVCYNDGPSNQEYFGDYHSLWSDKREGMRDNPITFALASTNATTTTVGMYKIPMFTVSFTGEDNGELATALKTMLTLNPDAATAARNIYVKKYLYVDTTDGVPVITSCTKVTCTETGTEITLGKEAQGMELIKENHIQFGNYAIGRVVVVLRNQSGSTFICTGDSSIAFTAISQELYAKEVKRSTSYWSGNKIASDIRIQQGGIITEGLVKVIGIYQRALSSTPAQAVIL